MTDGALRDFDVRGHLRVPGVLDADAVQAMSGRLWQQLARYGALPDDRSTWQAERANGLQAVRDGDPDPADSPGLVGALDALMGPGRWRTKPNWGQALVTFPTGEPWTVPGGSWHLDHSYWYPPDEVWGVNVFLIVHDLPEHGGGTGIVEGSPELIRRWLVGKDPKRSTQKQLRRGFEAKHDYFRRLADRGDAGDRREFTEVVEIDGVEIRVVEATGRAGDVVICHPWALHDVMPNAGDHPRFMRACRAYHRDLFARLAD